jgi:hypothetical protein
MIPGNQDQIFKEAVKTFGVINVTSSLPCPEGQKTMKVIWLKEDRKGPDYAKSR